MQVEGSKLKFEKTLWVQFEGVDTSEEGGLLVVQGRSDDSYVKVFDQFGRLLKLFTFSNGRWVDSETNAEPTNLDLSQAGRLPMHPAVSATSSPRTRAKPASARRPAAAAKAARAKTKAKRPAKKSAKPASKAKGKSMVMKKAKKSKKATKSKAGAKKKTKARKR